MTELDFEYLRDVLDNITYWETCPDKDKQRLRLLVKQIDEHRELVKKLNIDDVSKRYIVCTDINYKNELTVISHEFTGIEDAKLFKEYCLETEKYKGKNLLILNVC